MIAFELSSLLHICNESVDAAVDRLLIRGQLLIRADSAIIVIICVLSQKLDFPSELDDLLLVILGRSLLFYVLVHYLLYLVSPACILHRVQSLLIGEYAGRDACDHDCLGVASQ